MSWRVRESPSEAAIRRGSEDGPALAERCLLADTPRLRLIGLLGRPGLEPGDGLLLRRSGSIHMFFMRFAIDAVFLDREDRVIKIVPELRPWQIAAARGARSVIELASGECQRRSLAVGESVCVIPLGGTI